MKKKIKILGAGLSGMIAAINLARDGWEVEVMDKEKKIGGPAAFHPSLHVTPFDRDYVSEYTGVDLRPPFVPVGELRVMVMDRKYLIVPDRRLCTVERGPRKSSADVHLYNIALKEGVKFSFGVDIKDPRKDLPKGSIIATGLSSEIVKEFNFPYMEVFGYTAVRKAKESEPNNISYIYLDDRMSPDYFYGVTLNDITYGLLFGRSWEITKKMFDFCTKRIKENDNVEFDNWRDFRAQVTARPTLFWEDFIFIGTSAGMIDPNLGFGIHGACLSGKIAAVAVKDKDKAQAMFDEANKYFWKAKRIWDVTNRIPRKYDLMNFFFKFKKYALPLTKYQSKSIPGLNFDWVRPNIEALKRID
jgi:flavin-dependent dehydrogenase